MNTALNRRHLTGLFGAGLLGAGLLGNSALAWGQAASAGSGSGALSPLFDAHIHYSHDAWGLVPPRQAIAILRKSGLKGALVSSSAADDQGTQMLIAEAPDLIVAELRPYRTRGEISTWVRDTTVVGYLEDRLRKSRYVGIGEFHVSGEDADLPVPQRMVALARERGLVLHAHSDVDAIDRIFRQWPDARVLWAHSGFERPEKVRETLRRHPRLWSDLAFRNDHATANKVDPAWREAFLEFPERFVVGTDTFTPERWHYIEAHASYCRAWLKDLPAPVAERISWRNAEELLRPGVLPKT